MTRVLEIVSLLFIGAAVAVFGGGWLLDQAGRLDGLIWPVVTPLQIDQYAKSGERISRFSGHANKLRDCEFRSVEWHYGSRETGSVPVAITFQDPAKIRRIGPLVWSEITVALAPDALQYSYAIAVHDCGWPWFTRSAFYP